jgi:hypothetical protein
LTGKLFAFLWDGKPDKISRNIIKKEYEDGGLKMIDVNAFVNALKANWVKKLIDPENKGQWKAFYKSEFNKLGGKLFLECNISEKDVPILVKNTFLQEILSSWAKANYTENISSVIHEILWHNSNIKVDNKTLFFQNWYNNGIKHIGDIYDSVNDSFLTFEQVKLKFSLANSEHL